MANRAAWLVLLLTLSRGCGSVGQIGGDSVTVEELERREKYLNSKNTILASSALVILPLAYRDEVVFSGNRKLPVKKVEGRLKQKVLGMAWLKVRQLEIRADESIELLYEDETFPSGRIYILAQGHVSHIEPQRIRRGMKTLEIHNGRLEFTGSPEVQEIE